MSVTMQGSACRSFAITGLDVCLSHSTLPEHIEMLRKARVKGGRVGKWNKDAGAVLSLEGGLVDLRTVSDVRWQLCRLYTAVKNGEMPPNQAGSLAYILSAALKTFQVERELGDTTAEPLLIELVWPHQPDTPLLPEPETDPK